jgi:tetratricopeptide (TPR) repeat protein
MEGQMRAPLATSRASLTALVCLLGTAVPSAGPPALEDLLERYERGDFSGAVQAMRTLPKRPPVLGGADRVRLDPLFLEWMSLAPRWIASGEAGRASRRRLVAASFALEIAHARAAVQWFLRYPFVAWACGELRSSPPPPHPGERWWHLAAIAVMQDNDDWPHVMGGLWTQARASAYLRRTPKLFFGDADREEAATGHLAHARAAVPGEVRWRLAEVHFEESQTVLEAAAGPIGIGGHQMPRAERDQLARAAAGQHVGPPLGPMSKAAAAAALDRLGRIPSLIQRYESLNGVPSLRGDVSLHLGFLRIRLEEWDEALVHLREVPRLTPEPALVSLSHHFAGWVYQQTGQRDAAIEAYRQALATSPGSRSTSILLAAQLLDAGRQADAYALLHGALEARRTPGTFAAAEPDPPPDLWPLYPRGDAVLLPTYLARLREAIR